MGTCHIMLPALHPQGPKAEKRRRRQGRKAEPGGADKQAVKGPGAQEPLEVVREVVSEDNNKGVGRRDKEGKAASKLCFIK